MAGEIIPDNSELEGSEDSSVGGSQEPVSQSEALRSTEEALAGRVQTALNSPRIEHDSMTPSSVSYRLLKEDLKFRSEHNKVLMQEQSMAGNMRAQHELGKLTKKNDEDALKGVEALQMAQNLHQGGVEDAEIRIQVAEKHNLYAFPNALKKVDNFLSISETPLETAQRGMREKTAKNNLFSKSYNAEVEAEEAEYNAENIEKNRAMAELVAKNANNAALVTEVNLRSARTLQAFQNKNNEYEIAKLGAGAAGRVLASAPSMDKVQDMFDDIGVEGNAQLVWSSLPTEDSLRFLVGGGADGPGTRDGSGLFGLLAEKMSTSSKTIKEEDIWKAVQDLGDPKLRKLADAGDEDAIDRLSTATNYLRRGGRLYQSKYADAIQYRKDQTIRAEVRGKLATRHTVKYDKARKLLLEYEPPSIGAMADQTEYLDLIIKGLQGDLSVKSGRPLSSGLDWDAKKNLLDTHKISYDANIPTGVTTGEDKAWGWETSEQMEKLLWKGHEAGIWLYDGIPRKGDTQETPKEHKKRGMAHLLRLMEVHAQPTTAPKGTEGWDLDAPPTKR